MKILSITAQKVDSTGSGVFLTELTKGFRKLGCTELALNPGFYPDEIAPRYGFNENLIRSIDNKCFDWSNPNAKD